MHRLKINGSSGAREDMYFKFDCKYEGAKLRIQGMSDIPLRIPNVALPAINFPLRRFLTDGQNLAVSIKLTLGLS